MAPRTQKIRHDEETRLKIKTSQIINRLQDHILGELDLKPTQVQAALGLIRKTLPDLTQSDNTTTIKHESTEYSRDELIAVLEQSHARNGGAGITPTNGRGGGPDSVH